MTEKLSPKDDRILSFLREHSRSSIVQIARKLGMPRTTVYDKIRRFKSMGLIRKYTCLIDPMKVGYPIHAIVLFKLNRSQKEFGNFLQRSVYTNNVTKMGNSFDYMSSFYFKTVNDLQEYIEKLTASFEIKEYKILYIAKELKSEGFKLDFNS